MPYVEIYKLKNDGSQDILAVCRLEEGAGEVVCESANPVFTDNLKREGIKDYSGSGKERLFPYDGRKFLEQLKFHFRSAYLSASDVIEK